MLENESQPEDGVRLAAVATLQALVQRVEALLDLLRSEDNLPADAVARLLVLAGKQVDALGKAYAKLQE